MERHRLLVLVRSPGWRFVVQTLDERELWQRGGHRDGLRLSGGLERAAPVQHDRPELLRSLECWNVSTVRNDRQRCFWHRCGDLAGLRWTADRIQLTSDDQRR